MQLMICRLFVGAAMLAAACPAWGIILAAKEDRNTRAPAGLLADSGWQWQGEWMAFTGTPISRKYFITAGHIGGQVGDYLTLNGKRYKTIATYDDPESDLQLWQIHGRFDTWAPMFKEDSEVGRTIMLFGRGSQRGDPVFVDGQLQGWRWGSLDGRLSWGKNVITDTGAAPENVEASPLSISGDQIIYTFDRDGVGHEGTVSNGDSGGGVFVRNGRLWRLVGITSTVESGFAVPGGDQLIDAALLDAGGMRTVTQVISDTSLDKPTHAYATRISPRVQWIYDVLNGDIAPSLGARPAPGVPEPASAALLLAAGSMLLLRRR